MSTYHLGIDLMGSENSPVDLFQAVLLAISKFQHVQFSIFISPFYFDQIQNPLHPKIKWILVDDYIAMHDDPLESIRVKKESSMVKALHLLKHGEIDALISAGNTGALIAGSALFLSKIGQFKKPGLLANVPTQKAIMTILDVGGLVQIQAPHYVELAQIGAAYRHCLYNESRPRVGLLNIGVEAQKGTEELQKAYRLLQESQNNFEFIGNVEASDVYRGHVDVLVTDAFAGNVLLKASEGVYSLLAEELHKVLESNGSKDEILRKLSRKFNFEEYMGAIVCGVDRLVVKCHGKAGYESIFHAIEGAEELLEKQFIGEMQQKLRVMSSSG